jgi:uncharacterized protein (TIGR02594 family)
MRTSTRIALAIGFMAACAPALSEPLRAAPSLVSEARKYMGTNPTGRKKLWCAAFMNLVLAKAGYDGTHSDAARSFAYYGRRIPGPQVGAIAVLTRGKRGGHVGVVAGIDRNGNPIIISGNHNHRVGEGVYPRDRVIAYVMPTERRAAGIPLAPRPERTSTAIDSPIAELLAAIEAEQTRSNRGPQQPQRPQRGPEHLDMDPFLADLLGLRPHAQPAAQPAPQRPVQRQQLVEQLPAHVAMDQPRSAAANRR